MRPDEICIRLPAPGPTKSSDVAVIVTNKPITKLAVSTNLISFFVIGKRCEIILAESPTTIKIDTYSAITFVTPSLYIKPNTPVSIRTKPNTIDSK